MNAHPQLPLLMLNQDDQDDSPPIEAQDVASEKTTDVGGSDAPAANAEEFNWLTEDCVVVESQPAIAVYRNRRGHVVIRSQGDAYDDDDKFTFIGTADALELLIAALQRELEDWQ